MSNPIQPSNGPRGRKRKPAAGGTAPAAGMQYQAQVNVHISAHILTGRPLDWFPEETSIVAKSWRAETTGPGDDLLIQLNDGRCIEVQVKRGAKLDEHFDDAILRLASGLRADERLLGALVVDDTSARSI